MNESKNMTVYPVWKPAIRIFHGINFICVLGLIGIGLIILYNKDLGVNTDGKILLKTLHAYLGYLFVVNLLIRFIYFFSTDRYSNGKAIFSFKKQDFYSLKLFIQGFKKGKPPNYLGHNPIAKIMIAILFLLLSTQAITGLVLAGTDLYLPPFGHEIAEWVTGSGEDHSKLVGLKAGSKEGVEIEAYNEMRRFRKPFITIHKYVFYSLLIALFFHIIGGIWAEIKEKSGLVSAMITGSKVFSKEPVDYDKS
jgi:Ni,Fe-hydrogenase I cytochrome b subunit